jgi:hypothetical protein
LTQQTTVRFDLTAEDYAEFSVLRQSSGLNRKSLRNMRVVFPVIWIGMAALGGITPGDMPWLVLAVAWFFGLPAYARWNLRRRVLRAASTGLSWGYLGPHVFTLGPEGVADETRFARMTTIWAGIERIDTSPRHVLFHTGPEAAFLVPKTAFADEAAIAAFIDTAEQLRRQAPA